MPEKMPAFRRLSGGSGVPVGTSVERGPDRVGTSRARSFAIFVLILAAAAFVTPLWAGEPPRAAGFLLVGGLVAELVQSFRYTTAASQRTAWMSAAYTLLLVVILLSAPWIAATALAIVAAIPFVLDMARSARAAARQAAGRKSFRQATAAAAGNAAAAAGVILIGIYAPHWVVAIAAGIRLSGVAVNLATVPAYSAADADESVAADILDRPEITETAARLEEGESSRAAADRGWIWTLLAVLLAIHVSRMGFDKSALGIVSPLVAVLGDVAVALILAYVVIVPLRLFVRRSVRRVERRAWLYLLDDAPAGGIGIWWTRAVRWWLESRMQFAIRLRSARFSLASAFGRGLQIGLPLAAVIVASVPIWGMSWYFDTENWAAGMWNSWAASRTDTWRAAMVRAVVASGEASLDGRGFAMTPAGVVAGQPFSFVVIGDTGEGDASQHVLRDSLIRAAEAADVRFVVISSDVVYPTGAMRDYELRFWLPFKGVTKPVYAIPGNHDWYDALEGFAATFFTPSAARTAMRARIEADKNLSSTTDVRIDEYLRTAAALRQEYGVPTGAQRAPFFTVETPEFALLAIDTGVLRVVDSEQLGWLRNALERSRGKMVMAIVGHPFLAGGHDVTLGDEKFSALRSLLRGYADVHVVMAGDTHDLEYYRESVTTGARPRVVHHWVNGGGGAYLSFGTALAWPGDPPSAVWAHYPTREDVVAKITARTPWWKWPAWLWTRELGAWPASEEWLSAMFDYNVAPFFQSFVVATFDPAARTITVRPWGVHGPLRWRDVSYSADARPQGASRDDAIEWVVR
jgi:calcineurin-like phosphoesterase family protein